VGLFFNQYYCFILAINRITMIIDLSHPISNNTPVYPGTPNPRIEVCNTLENDGFVEHLISLSTHTGTHIDAPSHMLKDGKKLCDFPLNRLIGNGYLINCSECFEIELPILKQHEAEIKTTDILVIFTGWSTKWSTGNYFDGYPVLTSEAARWLTQFDLKAVGFDAISADKVEDHNYTNHHIFLENEILIIENLTNLELLPNPSFEFFCIPLNIKDTDGAPVRAFAKVEV
jgi:arylformamidase